MRNGCCRGRPTEHSVHRGRRFASRAGVLRRRACSVEADANPQEVSAMERSEIMRRVRSKDTKPEMAIRIALHRAGYRYRLHAKELPGKPDLVFPARRAALFVHGCWWHGHSCKRGQRAATNNAEYWNAKINRNIERDKAAKRNLRRLGWRVIEVWECEIKNPKTLNRIKRFLDRESSI